MTVNLMSWNTGLGNLTKETCGGIFEYVNDFLKKENAIAILQEMPYMVKKNELHPFYNDFIKDFPETIYNKTYAIEKSARSITVVLSNNQNLIRRTDAQVQEYGNKYVSFQILGTSQEMNVLAVHSPNGAENVLCQLDYLKKSGMEYQLVVGDFNAGDYEKDDNDFKKNREKYCKLLNDYNYKDLFDEKPTTKKPTTIYNTFIDHILVKNSFSQTHKVGGPRVEEKLSDHHYPITVELELL